MASQPITGYTSFGINVFDTEPATAIDISRNRDYRAVAGRKSKTLANGSEKFEFASGKLWEGVYVHSA